MQSQRALLASLQNWSPPALSRFHQGRGSSTCVRGSCTVAAPFPSWFCNPHLRTNLFLTQRDRCVESTTWEISQRWQRVQGLTSRKHRLRKPCSQADTEADSIEDFNLEELDDEQLEDLFETYGEIVKSESEPCSISSEADDDAESLAFALALAEVANGIKAGEIQVLCVKPLVYWTRFFVIATGFSRPQVDAIGKRMRDVAEERYKRTPRGDLKPNAWTLLDFGVETMVKEGIQHIYVSGWDVVVHIFYPKERSYYNLEEFYGNAISVELPFNSRSQMH